MLLSKTFIFNFTGVLAADISEQFSSFQGVVVEKLKSTLSYNEYMRNYFGLPDREAMSKLVEDKAPSGDLDAALITKRRKYSNQFSTTEIPAVFEAIELVKDLYRDGKKCFLVTSSSQEDVEKFIIRHKLNEVFPASSQNYVTELKNLRELYTNIIKATDDDPTKCVLIDIALQNLTLARELGIGTISFATSRVVSRAEVDALVRDAKELRDEYIEFSTSVIEQGGVSHE